MTKQLLTYKIYSIMCVIGGAIGYMVGGFTMATKTLLILMVVDVLSQLIVASIYKSSPKSKTGGLNSNSCWYGICRKVMTFFCVVVAWELECVLKIPVKDLTVTGFIISESISILENAGEMGIKLPKKLRECIDVLREKEEEKEEEKENGTNK